MRLGGSWQRAVQRVAQYKGVNFESWALLELKLGDVYNRSTQALCCMVMQHLHLRYREDSAVSRLTRKRSNIPTLVISATLSEACSVLDAALGAVI